VINRVLSSHRLHKLVAAFALAGVLASGGGQAAMAADQPAGYPTVAIVPGSTINLVARESKIPLSIRNDFDATVTVHAYVVPDSYRVFVPHAIEVKIPPQTTITAQVPVKAFGNGEVGLRAYLETFSGLRIGKSVKLHMVVNADIETWIIIAFGTTVAGLLALGAVRTIRRRRNHVEINNFDKYETDAIDIIEGQP
jgi:hypothetical protein